ncbi:L-threonylcarbamoyladenylate synthase [Stenoxybacter acetivorans]|uniref:L-threonylcarbamoyladenylate synthase n=1 Tax=Stenoxybacter acetivorans TaxID=422441 RepID=UPI000563B178|nr:L-threonylcarbamoyladenylate synthase [Stenoxybacter acetivorans]
MALNNRPAGKQRYRLRAHLKAGGVVAYPTESSYGLGCLPRHALGLRRIVQLKKRNQHKGLVLIGHDWASLRGLLHRLPENQEATLLTHWPAAKTFLLPAAKRVLPLLRGKGRSTLAVRIPDLETARFLCRAVGSALVSTSCNCAGKRACRQSREVCRQFGKRVWIIDGRIGKQKQPSQIIDWASGKRLR